MDELISLPFGSTSNILWFPLRQTDGTPFTSAITHDESASIIVYWKGGNASYVGDNGEVQAIVTPGTFLAPSTNCCRFDRVATPNGSALYELQLADSLFSQAGIDELRIVTDITGAAPCWIRAPLTGLAAASELSRALAVLSDSLPFRPDPSRTHIMRRANGTVGSNIVIPKKHSEIQEFYADVHALLGDNEFIGDVGDISITATTATVLSVDSLTIGRTGKYIRYWLSGGTNGATDTITIQFNSIDVDGNPIGDPTICTAFIKHIA